MHLPTLLTLGALAFGMAAPLPAQTAPAPGAATPGEVRIQAPWGRAVVLAVYPEDHRLLLRHGPLPHLHMGPMTMEFAVQDAALLRGLRKGSQVRFRARQLSDDYLITQLQRLR